MNSINSWKEQAIKSLDDWVSEWNIEELQRLSVEIFLYYETALSQRLGLVTATQIGKRDWIDENSLVQKVEAHYFEELFELPVFEKMVKEGCREEWEAIDAEFDLLGECPEGAPNDEKVLEYQFRQGEMMQKRRRRQMSMPSSGMRGQDDKKRSSVRE